MSDARHRALVLALLANERGEHTPDMDARYQTNATFRHAVDQLAAWLPLWVVAMSGAGDAAEVDRQRALAALRIGPVLPGEIVHRCPYPGSILTPCCNRLVLELPHTDRLAVQPELVTCEGAPK